MSARIYLHVCARCDRPFYGTKTALFCARDRGVKPNGRCVTCGARGVARYLCADCRKDRNRKTKARWERAVRRTGDKRQVALHQPFYGLTAEPSGPREMEDVRG